MGHERENDDDLLTEFGSPTAESERFPAMDQRPLIQWQVDGYFARKRRWTLMVSARSRDEARLKARMQAADRELPYANFFYATEVESTKVAIAR